MLTHQLIHRLNPLRQILFVRLHRRHARLPSHPRQLRLAVPPRLFSLALHRKAIGVLEIVIHGRRRGRGATGRVGDVFESGGRGFESADQSCERVIRHDGYGVPPGSRVGRVAGSFAWGVWMMEEALWDDMLNLQARWEADDTS